MLLEILPIMCPVAVVSLLTNAYTKKSPIAIDMINTSLMEN